MILAKVVLKRIVSRYVFLQYMSPFLFKVIFQLFYVTDLYEFIYFLIFYCLEKIQVPYHKDLIFNCLAKKSLISIYICNPDFTFPCNISVV